MSDIDKDIDRCKELLKTEHSQWIGMTNQDAIYNVLFNLENYRGDCKKLTCEKDAYIRVCNELKSELEKQKNFVEHLGWNGERLQDLLNKSEKELETYKKIAEKLAETQLNEEINHIDICKEMGENRGLTCFLYVEDNEICKQCIIDWARKEVEK